MGNRRMFSIQIVGSDSFTEMSSSAQALYFHLGMRADDDGFVNNPKQIQLMVGASEDDLKILIAKRFLIAFENGVVVIKHWRMHNTIQRDRYKPTVYQTEFKQLSMKENMSYTLGDQCFQSVSNLFPVCIQSVSKVETQDKLSKDKTSKDKLEAVEDIAYGALPHDHINGYVTSVVSMSPTAFEKLVEFEKVLPDEVIRYAVDIMIDSGKSRSWNYLEGILRRLEYQGLDTMEKVRAAEAKRRQERNKSTEPTGHFGKNGEQAQIVHSTDFDGFVFDDPEEILKRTRGG